MICEFETPPAMLAKQKSEPQSTIALAQMFSQGSRKLRIDAADEELTHRVHLTLQTSGRVPLSGVTASAQNGLVTLRGQVPSYYLKQLAQTAVQHIAGVTKVHSEISVVAGTRAQRTALYD